MELTENEDARPSYKGPAKVEGYDVFQRSMAQAASAYHEEQKRLRTLARVHDDMTRAIDEKWLVDSKRESNVPATMTLPNRILRLLQQDRQDAMADFRAVKNACMSPRMSPEQIQELRVKGGWRVEETLSRLADGPISGDEFDARVQSGQILDITARDKSHNYKTLLDEYQFKRGDLSRKMMRDFRKAWTNTTIRVFQETDILFTTCNNAGSELVQMGFQPKILFVDEGGQLTMAAFANVLTSFQRWSAVQIFGDPKQLKPCVLSCRANEPIENAHLPVLFLQGQKFHPIIKFFLYQYHIAPRIRHL